MLGYKRLVKWRSGKKYDLRVVARGFPEALAKGSLAAKV
jgi:hypothetical protein